MNSTSMVEPPGRITSNVIYNWIGWIWPLLLGLIVTRFMVSHLGVTAYGILALLSVVTGYLSIMDLGLSEATIKFIAEYSIKGDIPTLQRLCRCSMFVFAVVGVLGAIIVVVTTPWLVQSVFHVPALLFEPAKFAFYLMAISFLINMVVGVLENVPEALQRYDILNRVRLVLGTLTTLATIAVLALHYSLVGVVVVQLASTLIGLIVQSYIAHQLLPNVTWWPRFDKPIFQRLFGFGGSILVNRITSVISYQVPQGIIAAIGGPSQVSYYAVPFKLASPLQTMFGSSLKAFFPMSASMLGAGLLADLKEVYLKTSRLLVLAVTGLTLPLVVLSRGVMEQWMGINFGAHSYIILTFLAGASWVNAFSVMPWYLLMGAGKTKYIAIVSLISAFCTITGCLILAPKHGAAGLAATILVSNFITVPILLWLLHSRVLCLSSLTVFHKAYIRPIVAAGLAGIIVYLGLASHITNLISLLIGMLILEALYLGLSFITGAISPKDAQSAFQYVFRFASIRIGKRSSNNPKIEGDASGTER